MRRLRILAPLAVGLIGGCDLVTSNDGCTLIGCNSGLLVQLAGPVAGPYRIEVRTPGSTAVFVSECTTAAGCTGTGGGFFPDFMPEQVSVTVTTARGTVRQDVRPTYTTSQPNGDECPPVCKQATVTVPLPA